MPIGGKTDKLWYIEPVTWINKYLSWLEENSRRVHTVCHLYKLKYTQNESIYIAYRYIYM